MNVGLHSCVPFISLWPYCQMQILLSLNLCSLFWSFCYFPLFSQDIQELFRLRQQEHSAWQEELLDGISAVLLGTEENVSQEDELLKALEDKYDTLRDKLLLEALEKQMGAAEWALLSEQERQARLAKLKLQERRLRQQGRFDDAAALLGEGLKNAEALQVLLIL